MWYENGILYGSLTEPVPLDVIVQIDIAEFHIDEIKVKGSERPVTKNSDKIWVLIVTAQFEDRSNLFFNLFIPNQLPRKFLVN